LFFDLLNNTYTTDKSISRIILSLDEFVRVREFIGLWHIQAYIATK